MNDAVRIFGKSRERGGLHYRERSDRMQKRFARSTVTNYYYAIVEPNQQPILEIEERVEQISSSLASLSTALGQGKAERQLLDEIFRQVHSLKATAASHQLPGITTLTHELENLLHAVRTGHPGLDSGILATLNEVVDALFAQLDSSKSSPSAVSSVVGQLQRLATLPSHRPVAEIEIILKTLPTDLMQSLNDDEKHKLHASVAEGANVFLVSTDFDVGNFDRDYQRLREKLSASGEVISTAPVVQPDKPGRINFRILYASNVPHEEVCSHVEKISGVSVCALDGNPEELSRTQLPTFSEAEQHQYIRVDVADLDRITSSAYALSHQLQTLVANHPGLEITGAELRQNCLELAAAIVGVRMMPVKRLLHRVVRAGRIAARSCGKEIEFKTVGEDLLLDQTICDAIADPLIHLVRNAVDHGIESAEDRVRIGKNDRGRITIAAASLHAQTRITVSDDGRGLDPQAIQEALARLGLHQNLPLTLDESVRLIFRSGFSTAKKVTETSGRGVGLDVVETEIERLGGQILVSSKPNDGATFEIRLPVTFGLLEVMIVGVADHQYLIDASHVISVKRIETAIDNDSGTLKLSDLLGQTTSATTFDGPSAAVVCQFTADGNQPAQPVSLVVDEVVDRRQVVIRSLGAHASRWFGVAGATELRNGRVALLLDLPRLLKS